MVVIPRAYECREAAFHKLLVIYTFTDSDKIACTSTSHWDRLHIADNHDQSILKFLQWHEISQATHNCTRFCKDIRNCEVTVYTAKFSHTYMYTYIFVSRNLKATNQVLTDIKVNCYSVVITTFRNTFKGTESLIRYLVVTEAVSGQSHTADLISIAPCTSLFVTACFTAMLCIP